MKEMIEGYDSRIQVNQIYYENYEEKYFVSILKYSTSCPKRGKAIREIQLELFHTKFLFNVTAQHYQVQ